MEKVFCKSCKHSKLHDFCGWECFKVKELEYRYDKPYTHYYNEKDMNEHNNCVEFKRSIVSKLLIFFGLEKLVY